jgi:hypothetical protein
MNMIAVDRDAPGRHRHHCRAGGRLRVQEAQNCRPGHAAGHHQQQHRIAQRRQDRGSSQTVGVAVAGRTARQPHRQPRDAQAQHVAEIMTGVGYQRQGIGHQSPGDFGDDIDGIKHDPDGERPSERSRRVMMMALPVPVSVVVPGRAVPLVVMVFVAHRDRTLKDLAARSSPARLTDWHALRSFLASNSRERA